MKNSLNVIILHNNIQIRLCNPICLIYTMYVMSINWFYSCVKLFLTWSFPVIFPSSSLTLVLGEQKVQKLHQEQIILHDLKEKICWTRKWCYLNPQIKIIKIMLNFLSINFTTVLVFFLQFKQIKSLENQSKLGILIIHFGTLDAKSFPRICSS